ncbi:MAG: InlB B-repeat-containing protein [Firmicutes bacterium]|nr:InlB B-repeat-containing protein [Bacillota bacterium]
MAMQAQAAMAMQAVILPQTGKERSAGIGGGYNGGAKDVDGGEITISGGKITANGNQGGAGVGGGRFCKCGTVAISGGDITANGGEDGAGIGSGYNGNGGTVEITGGTVTATGGDGGNGIGFGTYGSLEKIDLSWTNGSDSIYANSYGASEINLNKAFMLKDSETPATVSNIGGQTIVPAVVVSFDKNGGEGEMADVAVSLDKAYKLPECTFTAPENKEFYKWQIDEVQYDKSESVELTDDTVVTALWRGIQKNVSFDANGHGTAPEAQTVPMGELAAAPTAPEETGWEFGGWYSDKNCTTVWDFEKDTVTDDLTLYAKWTLIKYTISYELNGGTNADGNPTEYDITKAIGIAEAVKTGFEFLGWTYDDVTTPQTAVNLPVGTFGNKTFTANWKANKYTLTFKDGDTVLYTITEDYNTSVDAPADPIKENARFLGWDKEVPQTIPAENLTFTAAWDTLTKVNAVEPTCTADGNTEYWYNAVNKYFVSDGKGGYTECELSSTVLPAEHSYDYDAPVWTSTLEGAEKDPQENDFVVLTLKCTKCDDVYTEKTYAITSNVTKKPTMYEDGVLTYTATVTVNGHEIVYTYNTVIPKYVAKIDGKGSYSTLKEALDAAYDNDTVKLLADVDEPKADCGLDMEYSCYYKDIVLDLGGHYAKLGGITTSRSVSVKNGTLDIGEIYCDGCYAERTLELDNAVINANKLYWNSKNVSVKNGSELNIGEDATFGNYDEYSFELALDETSKITLTNTNVGSEGNIDNTIPELAMYLPAGFEFAYDDQEKRYYVQKDGARVTDKVTLLWSNFAPELLEAGVPATCESAGAYDKYKHGGIIYVLVDGIYKRVTDPDNYDFTIPALGHNWGGYVYEWADDYLTCTRKRICKNDNTHIDTPKTVDAIIKDGYASADFNGTETRYSHTANISDDGTRNGDYDVNLDTADTVKIDGAESLSITLNYGVEGRTYDYLEIYDGAGNLVETFNDTNKEGYIEAPTININGDTVTFRFVSDSSETYYGYYAIISADVTDIQKTKVLNITAGDVDFDGNITDEDAAMVLKYISTGKAFFEDDADKNAKAILAANADGKGGIDMLDVIKILQIAQENNNQTT